MSYYTVFSSTFYLTLLLGGLGGYSFSTNNEMPNSIFLFLTYLVFVGVTGLYDFVMGKKSVIFTYFKDVANLNSAMISISIISILNSALVGITLQDGLMGLLALMLNIAYIYNIKVLMSKYRNKPLSTL